ncbi:sensor histidine kinase [Cohnella lupini]|uniref:Sensor kinase SpoOB-type protein n=1 Tax=Cohnella lupini TaxID=1294267 RepID=A0A3D9IMW4_9BACL|nr:GHKL domain-containing protein [Cohnella lupini]RED63027.1 sensor kinase SpoOB-type protein [Cohnella lupini]
MKRTLFISTLAIVIVLILLNNLLFYFLTKESLTENLKKELLSIASQVELSIENSREASIYLEDKISENLKSVAVAAQYRLDPDIDNVTSDELSELAKQLNVQTITLLKQTDDDILLYKSSDPKEEGTSTKKWDPWYQAFQQLFEQKDVSIDWGYTSKNYWSGPFEYSATDLTKKNLQKYGYYYDGTTNYIIDPFVSDQTYLDFQKSAGVESILDNTIKAHASLLEITAFNPKTFGTEEYITLTDQGEELAHNSTRPIIFGSYTFKLNDDADLINKAERFDQVQSTIRKINGKTTLKMYIPVDIKHYPGISDKEGVQLARYVLSLVSDYESIQTTLNKQLNTLLLTVGTVTLTSIIIVIIFLRFLSRTRDRVVRATQETYIDEVNQMFISIRGQRHDLLNHMNTVNAMASLHKYDELRSYMKEWIGDVTVTNDIITIGQPAIAALIQSKIAVAILKRIHFTHEFENLTNFPLGIRSVDIVRLIGNLIDNAFDAVSDEEDDNRNVQIKGWGTDNKLHIVVSNPGTLSPEAADLIFEPGYSSKSDHSGLGLVITKQLVNKYKGSIHLDLEQPGKVNFNVSISLN